MSLPGELARCLKRLLNPFSCSIKPLRPDCKSPCRLNISLSVWMTEGAHGFSHLFCFHSVIPVSPTGSPTPSLPLAEDYVIRVQMHKQLKAPFSPVRWGLLSGKCVLPGSLRLCSLVSSITFKTGNEVCSSALFSFNEKHLSYFTSWRSLNAHGVPARSSQGFRWVKRHISLKRKNIAPIIFLQIFLVISLISKDWIRHLIISFF